MDGPTVVSHGSHRCKHASGHEGDAPLLAFSPREPELVIHLYQEVVRPELMAKLGRHRATKGRVCI
jgi:hypothetical protein